MSIQVSIIIPVYNSAGYLADCLDSVLAQSLTGLEVICIEDGSEDRSGEILQAYASRDSRLKVIYHDRNLGPAQSRNHGIEAAKGRFLRFVDADDLVPLESTELLFSTAARDNVDLVKGSLALFRDSDPSNYADVVAVPDKTRTHLLAEEQLWIPWWHTSYLMSAQLIHDNHLRYPDLIRGEDPVFLASVLVKSGCFSLVGPIVYLYRKYQKESGSGGSSFKHMMDTLISADMIRLLFSRHHPECWQHGYGPFLLGDLRSVLDQCELDSDQRYMINTEMARIWGSDDK